MLRLTRSRPIFLALTAIVWAAFTAPQVEAQWLKYKTAGIPRTTDEKPNLAAPTPRAADGHPDFSGMWRLEVAGRAESDRALSQVPAQEWAARLNAQRAENLYKDSPALLCLPGGPAAEVFPRKIIQTPGLMMFLYDDSTYRQIFLDGRELENDPNPSWMGYSVGRWEKDTLVVESNGYNDRSWLYLGYPHTEKLHITERLRHLDWGHLELTRRMEDPGALTKPYQVVFHLEANPDTEMLEYVCNENERDRGHLVGKASEEREVEVSEQILADYVGIYLFGPPDIPREVPVSITLEDGKLIFAGAGGGSMVLKPLSETRFTEDGTYFEFVKDAQGRVVEIHLQAVEGDLKGVRSR